MNKIVRSVRADSEEDAWRKFSKYAIPEFGLKRDSTLTDVKTHFGEYVIVYGPDNVVDFEGTRYERI